MIIDFAEFSRSNCTKVNDKDIYENAYIKLNSNGLLYANSSLNKIIHHYYSDEPVKSVNIFFDTEMNQLILDLSYEKNGNYFKCKHYINGDGLTCFNYIQINKNVSNKLQKCLTINTTQSLRPHLKRHYLSDIKLNKQRQVCKIIFDIK